MGDDVYICIDTYSHHNNTVNARKRERERERERSDEERAKHEVTSECKAVQSKGTLTSSKTTGNSSRTNAVANFTINTHTIRPSGPMRIQLWA